MDGTEGGEGRAGLGTFGTEGMDEGVGGEGSFGSEGTDDGVTCVVHSHPVKFTSAESKRHVSTTANMLHTEKGTMACQGYSMSDTHLTCP